MMDSFYYSILVLDIERFGRRSDVDQKWLRAQLREILTRVLAESSVPQQSLRWQDTGDGGIFLIPAEVPKRLLVESVVPRLHAALREHNTRASKVGRLRLRVALHAGEVATDVGVGGREGYVGRDLNLACRLVDSDVVRHALAQNEDAQLALIVSEAIHRSVVLRGDGGIDAATYRSVQITLKEGDETAWVHIPGVAAPASSQGAAVPSVDPEPQPPTPPTSQGRPATDSGIHLYGAVRAGRDVNVGHRTEHHHRRGQ